MPDRLTGVVDGVLGDDLSGWLANLDDPAVCETVLVRSEEGQEREFATFQYREDVCAALALPGKFGFAIPIHALAGLGDRISVYDRNGQALTHGVGLPIVQNDARAPPPDCARLFMHIPKTAGTSLRQDITGLLRPSETLLLYRDSDIGLSPDQLAAMPDLQKRQFSLVFGHFYMGLHQLLPRPSQYVTVLREARCRVRSNVMHHATHGTTFEYAGLPCPPSVAINEGLEDQFDNLMTRSIAGVTTQDVPLGQMGSRELDMAMQNIRRHFLFVGRYEALQDTLDGLCGLFGVPVVPVSTVNRTVDRPILYADDELAKIDWPALFARNRIDELFYSSLEREKLLSCVLSPAP